MTTRAVPDPAKRSRNRDKTIAALVTAARSAFSRNGYNATTTRSIAAAVGCSDALIQNYFGGKEGLLAAVLRSEGDVGAVVERFMARPPAASLPEEVDDTIRFVVATLRRGIHNVRILVERAMSDEEFAGRFVSATPREAACRGLADRLARDWPGVHASSAAADLIVSMSFEFGFVHGELLDRDAATIDRSIAATVPIIVAGISAR